MSILYHQCPICASKNIHFLVENQDFTVSNEIFEIWLCQDCQTAFTQNAPNPEHIGKYYQSENYVSHSDTKKGLINRLYHVARQMMLSTKTSLIERLNAQNPKKILDIGCGTGYFLGNLKSKNWQCLGIEPDPKARSFAQKNFGLEVLEAENFWKISEQFQVITLWHVLEHLHDLEKYFVKIKSLLAPNGVLVIAVPNHWAAERNHYKEHWAAWDTPRHLWHFSPQSLEFLAKRFGFRLTEQKMMPFDPFYIALLSEKYKNNPLALLSGFFWGGVSFLQSLFQTKKSSSIIYVLRHGTTL